MAEKKQKTAKKEKLFAKAEDVLAIERHLNELRLKELELTRMAFEERIASLESEVLQEKSAKRSAQAANIAMQREMKTSELLQYRRNVSAENQKIGKKYGIAGSFGIDSETFEIKTKED